jgi:hypothetical protein
VIEAIGEWTTEINGWHLVMILSTLFLIAFTGYGSGVKYAAQKLEDRLMSLGIHPSETENLIEIHDPETDKISTRVTWDDGVKNVAHEVLDPELQEWDSES